MVKAEILHLGCGAMYPSNFSGFSEHTISLV